MDEECQEYVNTEIELLTDIKNLLTCIATALVGIDNLPPSITDGGE